MMNSPNLTTVPLPPAKGRSIDGESRRPGSRTLPRAPDAASKLGKIQSPQMGRIHRPLRPRGPEHMAKMKAARGPYSDPRDTHIASMIRYAFEHSDGKPLSTAQLVEEIYAWQLRLAVC